AEARLANLIVAARSRPARPSAREGDGQRTGFLQKVYTAEEFDAADFKRDWLGKGVVVSNEPVIVGGPQKALKTSLVVDLAISIGRGVRFLRKFEVPRPRPVFLLSGESGGPTLQETMRRICSAKAVTPANANVYLSLDLPSLNDPADLAKLADEVKGR